MSRIGVGHLKANTVDPSRSKRMNGTLVRPEHADLVSNSHDGEIRFPVSGAQQAQADVPVGVYVL